MNHEIYKEVAADGVTYRVWDRVGAADTLRKLPPRWS